MKKTIAAIIITAILSGCQTAGETLTTSSTPIAVTGATASAIAGDMASRLAEQVGPANTTTLKMDKDTSEYAAALDIPAKMTVAPFMVTKLINSGQFELVQEVCEGDVITLALLLARWRKLLDGRADIDVVEDRILRSIEQLREGRGYISALQARRAANFAKRVGKASNDAEVLAPWLSAEAA